MPFLVLVSFLLAPWLAVASGESPASAITECDRLAANPEDPDRLLPGLKRAQMDLPAAIAACEAEVARQPEQPRLRYQLSRSLFYAGHYERALEEMRRTADAGYRQAQFVYGAMINNKRPHAPADICIAERYWLASARAGRQAARVSYVRHTLKGKFDGCKAEVTRSELKGMLTSAAAEASDYYERLLIEDLTEAFDSTGRGSRPTP